MKKKENDILIEELVRKALSKGAIRTGLEGKSVDELIEELNVYYQELEYQNDELQRIRAELEESQKHFQELYDDAPFCYATYSDDMVILSVNKIFYERNNVDVKSRKFLFTEFIQPESQDDFYFHLKKLRQSGQMQEVTLKMRCHGRVKHVKLSSNIEMKDQYFIYRSAIVDIDMETTLRKDLEDTIKKLEAETQERKETSEQKEKLLELVMRTEKLESLGVLAGGIAHDFNNLLAGIFGYIEMAKNKMEDPEKAQEFLDKALSTFENARDLSHRFLTFSKGGDPVKKVYDIKKIFEESLELNLSGSKVSVEKMIDPKLNSAEVDKNQITQVFANIIVNARQIMENGGQIAAMAENVHFENGEHPILKAGNYVKIGIIDNGPGIKEKDLKKVFDPFFTTKESGHGLGLATAYSIVKKHGGHIDVESEVGEGTAFTILLPASLKEFKEAIDEFAPDVEFNGRILVMDDMVALREVAGEMLRMMGFEVAFCSDGEEAVNKIEFSKEEKRPFDAVLLDLTVPGGMGGLETAQILRNSGEKIPLIAASGYSNDPAISSPENYGFSASIKKPFKYQELYTVISELISVKEK